MDSKEALVVFEGTKIRRTWHNDQWYFSVVDVVRVLTDSADPKDYWYRLKKREMESSGIELSTFCRQLKLPSADGKKYETDCANTESMFRIIQSVPSKKAEPFKRWLAKVGYERVQEIKDPELVQKRMKEIYKLVELSLIEPKVSGKATYYVSIRLTQDSMFVPDCRFGYHSGCHFLSHLHNNADNPVLKWIL